MKYYLVILVSLFVSKAFSQSYFVLDSGITLSVDREGFVYDYNHHTPVSRVTIKGGQYLIEDTNVLVTVDQRGSLFRKFEILPESIIGKGSNYFIGANNLFYGIDNEGYVNLVELDNKMKNPVKFGGNFFTTENDFYVVNEKGAFIKATAEGVKPSDIIILGGNYFMTNRGVVYTVADDGRIISQKAFRVGIIQKKGGNYFVDTAGSIYTVSSAGELKLPSIPMSLRIPAISRLGTNYFMDGAGKLFTVDHLGNVFERWINYDVKSTSILSL